MQGVVVNGGDGVMVWVVGCRRQGWVVQGVIVDGGGGWWCGWRVVDARGGLSRGSLLTEVVGWWWGLVEVGWRFVAAGVVAVVAGHGCIVDIDGAGSGHCHAPNMFGTVNIEHTIDSRLSWSKR